MVGLIDSKGLTKIQSIILIAVIVVPAVSGAVYVLLSVEEKPSDTIKIGVLGDVESEWAFDGLKLAAEQLNTEGGILGKQVELIAEDRGDGSNLITVTTALTKLLTQHKVDFVIAAPGPNEAGFACQDIIAQHKKILLSVAGNVDELTQRVLDDYEKYKYYFNVVENTTTVFLGMTNALLPLREITGFNKVGYLGVDLGWAKGIMDGLDIVLPELHGFDIVYRGKFPLGTVDFSSYFAAAEAEGVEILVPFITPEEGIICVKEWYDRQSPMVIYGGALYGVSEPESWEWTDGKCEYVSVFAMSTTAGYPFTTKTLQTREAYINRWNHIPDRTTTFCYDTLRYILPDAIRRAGTIETEAVIEALEETSIETSIHRNFVFTESHSVMFGENLNGSNEDFMFVLYFQWQNREFVPVYPKYVMEEAGATYQFPPWSGPWDKIT